MNKLSLNISGLAHGDPDYILSIMGIDFYDRIPFGTLYSILHATFPNLTERFNNLNSQAWIILYIDPQRKADAEGFMMSNSFSYLLYKLANYAVVDPNVVCRYSAIIEDCFAPEERGFYARIANNTCYGKINICSDCKDKIGRSPRIASGQKGICSLCLSYRHVKQLYLYGQEHVYAHNILQENKEKIYKEARLWE